LETILKRVCVGASYFSWYHLVGWNRIPEVQITALCDPDTRRVEDRRREFGIARRYSDYRSMIEKEKPVFVDSLLDGSEFETNGQDYLKTLDIVDACYRSAETGNPVHI
jgi:predicted dehydrogenase